MKRLITKILASLMLVSILMMAPIGVHAQEYKDETRIATLYTKNAKLYRKTQEVSAAYYTPITKIKSTNKSIAKVGSKKDGNSYTLYVITKKTGTTNISYKVGEDIHKVKVVVKKYQNPFQQVKVNGKDVTSQFNKSNVCILDYKKYKNKKIKLKFKKKGRWLMPHADYCTKSYKRIQCIGSMSSPEPFKVTKKGSIASLWSINTKTNMTEDCLILFK